MPEKDLESDKYKLPKGGWQSVVSLAALSLLPTGAFGWSSFAMRGFSDKLDAVISRLDRLEGAGTAGKVDDHEQRLRRLEEELVRIRVLVEGGGKK